MLGISEHTLDYLLLVEIVLLLSLGYGVATTPPTRTLASPLCPCYCGVSDE